MGGEKTPPILKFFKLFKAASGKKLLAAGRRQRILDGTLKAKTDGLNKTDISGMTFNNQLINDGTKRLGAIRPADSRMLHAAEKEKRPRSFFMHIPFNRDLNVSPILSVPGFRHCQYSGGSKSWLVQSTHGHSLTPSSTHKPFPGEQTRE